MVSLTCKDPCVQFLLISEWEDFCNCSIVIVVYYIPFCSCVTGLQPWISINDSPNPTPCFPFSCVRERERERPSRQRRGHDQQYTLITFRTQYHQNSFCQELSKTGMLSLRKPWRLLVLHLHANSLHRVHGNINRGSARLTYMLVFTSIILPCTEKNKTCQYPVPPTKKAINNLQYLSTLFSFSCSLTKSSPPPTYHTSTSMPIPAQHHQPNVAMSPPPTPPMCPGHQSQRVPPDWPVSEQATPCPLKVFKNSLAVGSKERFDRAK